MKALKVVALSSILTLAAVTAEAFPILQFDIIGGHSADASAYYVSTAVSPNPGPSATWLGSFKWNATNYDVTDDMTYGTPPLDVDSGANLPSHAIFPMFFTEFDFQFSAANRVLSYNSEDTPGNPLAPTSTTTGLSYFATFNVTTALIGTNVLHFDLYNAVLRDCKRHQDCEAELNLDLNAPFSHDAESSYSKVAEPGSMLLISIGLLFAARSLSRVKKA